MGIASLEVRGVYRRRSQILLRGRYKSERWTYWIGFKPFHGTYVPPMAISKALFEKMVETGVQELVERINSDHPRS